MSRYSDSSLMSGLGRRRRRRVGRPRGRGPTLASLLGGRRRVHHRRRRGRGFLDIIKSALPFVKASGIVGHLAGMIPGIGGVAGSAARALGYGRRRRRVHRRRRVGGLIGGAHHMRHAIARHMIHAMGRRRVHHRVHHRRGRGLLL